MAAAVAEILASKRVKLEVTLIPVERRMNSIKRTMIVTMMTNTETSNLRHLLFLLSASDKVMISSKAMPAKKTVSYSQKGS